MLVLLPPSEGKASRRRGAPVDVDALSFPELNVPRVQVLRALAAVSTRRDATTLLGVGASLGADVERNVSWRSEPALPASALYSGVLYDALDLSSLPVGARRKAATRLLVASAAWGVLRPADRVPPYRLSMDVDLAGVGPLAAFWRRHLRPTLDAVSDGRLVVDCRSGTYAAAWRPRGGAAERSVAVRILQDVDGTRTVVSHLAKQTRGLVTRHLLARTGADPRTPEQLAAAVAEAFDVELSAPARGRERVLDVVVRRD